MGTAIGFVIGLAIAAGLYFWLSNDKPATAVRTIFARGSSGGAQQK